jgi:hypothetical protein
MDPHELNRRIRAKLTAIGRTHPAVAGGIVEVIELLDDLAGQIGYVTAGGTSKPSRKTPKTYGRDQRTDGWYLAEHREGGKQPFLVHEDIYGAFLNAMAKVKRPEPFDDVLARAGKLYRKELPIYQGRVVIRFWLSRNPALVRKAGRAYCPVNPSQFAAKARKAFRNLPSD